MLNFQNTHNIHDKLALTVFHPEVHKLAALVPSIDLDITSEEELILDLLDIESNFCITYDTSSNKLMKVSLEAIGPAQCKNKALFLALSFMLIANA